MKWKLPPLNALRSFEAAARLKSFSAGAEELNVTPGAISRQIAKLEDYLGVTLFTRGTREVEVTAVGAEYLETASALFATLHRETARISKDNDQNTLTIWSSMTVAMRWLVPHLTDYYAMSKDQGMEVAITTSLRPLVGNSREFDFAVRYGRGDWPGFSADLLLETDLIPVCSPSFLDRFPTGTPQDLAGQTLLHSQVRPNDWQSYLNAAGIADINGMNGLKFESSAIAYQAAAKGLGVAIGQRSLVQEDIETGKLIMPISFSIPTDGAFYLIYLPEILRNKRAAHFRNWLLKIAAVA